MPQHILLSDAHEKNRISDVLKETLESIGTIRRMRKETYLFREGMNANEVFIIKSGLVQVSKLTAEGKKLTLRICKTGDIIGELTLFSQNPTYLLSAKVIESGEILVIEKERLEKHLKKNGDLAIEFMKWGSDHMRKFQTKIRDLLLNGKKGALYSTLIRLSNSFGIKHHGGILIDLPLTNQELAQFCAATRESVNRMLSELRKLNIISMTKEGKIFIKNINYLKTENGCENCPVEICNIN